ncbi:GNAT family N-acetyltransferase [Amycolatopsis sp. H20-H5]|uniref:GNAT family N-acetyltransferase n=1 Tax=Amycolatopsis sp. H20-H5 TaxID=3046309 RepID=UPI002DBB5717|nr:GNAT family N-acetyltransferase [Amycolatopsis sp. H20-H5]MEC3973742.1 GNAT family N-acetyltransferase [Amycolatopsis sp. H20-H5]
MSQQQVRAANLSDAAAIAEIHVRSWQAAYAGLLPADYLDTLSVEARTRGWERAIGNPDRPGRILLLSGDGALSGFAAIGPSRDDDADPEVGELLSIYLRPELWGLGLGRTLHDHALGELAQDGFRVVTLWVLDSNERARGFYERAGWSADGAAKTDALPGGDVLLPEVRYRLPLSARNSAAVGGAGC